METENEVARGVDGKYDKSVYQADEQSWSFRQTE